MTNGMTDDERARLRNVEQAVTAMQVEQAELRAAIAANAEMTAAVKADTAAVKADTAEVVHLLKGGRVFGRVVAWTAGMGAVLYAVRDWIAK